MSIVAKRSPISATAELLYGLNVRLGHVKLAFYGASFYSLDAFHVAQPTASKHSREMKKAKYADMI